MVELLLAELALGVVIGPVGADAEVDIEDVDGDDDGVSGGCGAVPLREADVAALENPVGVDEGTEAVMGGNEVDVEPLDEVSDVDCTSVDSEVPGASVVRVFVASASLGIAVAVAVAAVVADVDVGPAGDSDPPKTHPGPSGIDAP